MYILLPYAYIQHLYISWQHLSVIESLRVLIALCFHLMSHLYFFMWSYTFGVFIMQSLSHLTVIFSLFKFFVLNNPANHNHFIVWYIYLQRKGSMNFEIQNPHPMGLGFWMKTGNQVQYWKIFFSSRYKNEYISKIMALGSEVLNRGGSKY